MSRFNPLLWPRPSVIWSYGITALSVVAALVFSRWPVLHLETAPVSLFFCAVMLSAWFGGIGPGLLATALSSLAFDFYFLPPIHTLAPKPEEIPRLIIFTVSALFVGSLSAAQRSATNSLRHARDDLKGTVQELQRTNEALRAESIERQNAEDKLRRSEAYLTEAQRLSHTGSWAFNARAVLYWSEENFLIWGFNPQQGLPDRTTILERIHPEDRDRMLEYVQKAMREKRDYAVEFRIVLPGGTVKHIQGLGHPVFSANGELVEVVGTQLDITERKHAEEEREKLRQAQADLAHISRVNTMGELTASLAHEVNQPIAAAVTDASTCLRWLVGATPNIEEAREAAMRTVKDGKRAAEIVSRIRLLFTKGSSQRELVDVNEVIREMNLLLRSELTRYSISVRTDLAANLPQIMGDRVQLQQVLMNLMINGIDAMKDVNGTRELAIKSHQGTEHLMVSVNDTGLGLPHEQANQIFDAFFTTKAHGTGMGLSVSRSIVESHGGRLWAASNSGRGTTFHFTLPIKTEAHE
ncbi:MAG: hypothetical protein JWM83_1336 [Candidatus Angelobacter sp.]|nr:hypothetical protein [Candidatus Angelobacter sp.]